MILTFLLFLLTICSTSLSKGLYSGVPCHRPYSCIFEEDEDGVENSLLVGEEFDVETEKTCQDLCRETEGCVSYSWWTENNTIQTPLLCQMFSVCHRNYHNPHFTPAYSGEC